MTDTIYAVASGIGKTAVTIVRVSGSLCSEILARVCPARIFQDRRATLASIFDEDNELLDRALIIRFYAPRSFTGEDMVEFQITGSRAVLNGLIRVITCMHGTRPAEAGEFARRAFENGKLDLVEVEGLSSVVDAETNAQLRHALSMAAGHVSRSCDGIRARILKCLAHLEAILDFSDVEDAAPLLVDEITPEVEECWMALTTLLGDSKVTERLRSGMVVAIAGPPNAGKSTLFNHLARRDIAIVSPFPGTTRDTLEVAVEIGGFPVVFVDTAGIRETRDLIEAEGVRRAKLRSTQSDLVLWLADDENSSAPVEYELSSILRVHTKADLRQFDNASADFISISAHTGFGVDTLINAILERASIFFAGAGSIVVGTERQRLALKDALLALDRVKSAKGLPAELIAEDLRAAATAVGRISGRVDVEEVLGAIFSRLCIGK